MRWKLPLVLGVVVALAAGFLLFRQSAPPVATEKPTAAPPERARIALVMKTLTSPFFVEMEKVARSTEAELVVALLVKTAAQYSSM